jgi:hypothetical protein
MLTVTAPYTVTVRSTALVTVIHAGGFWGEIGTAEVVTHVPKVLPLSIAPRAVVGGRRVQVTEPVLPANAHGWKTASTNARILKVFIVAE